MRIYFNKKGISIIEVMVSVAIVGVVMGLIYTTLYSNWRGYNRALIAANMQFEARRAMGQISRDIRQSEGVAVTPNRLGLTVQGVNIIYDIAANTLTKQTGAGPARIFCENIDNTDPVFSLNGARAIDVSIRIVQSEGLLLRGGQADIVFELSSTIQRRSP